MYEFEYILCELFWIIRDKKMLTVSSENALRTNCRTDDRRP